MGLRTTRRGCDAAARKGRLGKWRGKRPQGRLPEIPPYGAGGHAAPPRKYVYTRLVYDASQCRAPQASSPGGLPSARQRGLPSLPYRPGVHAHDRGGAGGGARVEAPAHSGAGARGGAAAHGGRGAGGHGGVVSAADAARGHVHRGAGGAGRGRGAHDPPAGGPGPEPGPGRRREPGAHPRPRRRLRRQDQDKTRAIPHRADKRRGTPW